jgi:hypothetical protein
MMHNFLRELLADVGGRFDEYGAPVFPTSPEGERARLLWQRVQALRDEWRDGRRRRL